MSEQQGCNGSLERTATTVELGDDALENVAGGRGETIRIFREPTYHPAKVVVPS
jgi:hypothetical protein